MTQESIKDLTDDPEVIEKNSVTSDVLRVSGKNRNKPCACRSGKKSKQCCYSIENANIPREKDRNVEHCT